MKSISIANQFSNAKFIGHTCVMCKKMLQEEERQKIISLGCMQTWCLLCMAKRFLDDMHLANFVATGNTMILYRNALINSAPIIRE